MLVEEYDLTRESTLTVIRESEIANDEVRQFRADLHRLAGKRLRLVWGPVALEEMSTDPNQLRYLDLVHNGVQLGERRWIVEIWRSPSFLERSGRYKLETIQDVDGEKLLKSIPSEGCYDYWLRLERADMTTQPPTLKYQPADNEAMQVVRRAWEFEQESPSERDALDRANREQQRRAIIAANREQRNQLWGFDPDDYQVVPTSDGSFRVERRHLEI